MKRDDVIGRGTWLDKVAADLIDREEKLGRSLSLVRVESGLGASGIPHVGSLGDAVRAYGVMLALKDKGYRSELIAYSDDMDGLRKVPEGLPSWLNDYLAHPVSRIPDPFDCHPSYGAHMSSILTDGLDKLDVEYRFQSGAEAYRRGLLNEQIAKILEKSHLIGKKIAEMLGQKKFEDILPYYPVCASCGRIYVAEAYRYDPRERKVLYRCRGAEVGRRRVEGCGCEGEADVTAGEGKLSWKGEFAARWAALDIRFEAYGKDIADSVKVNDWIAEEVLGYPPPHHVRYELFLDKSGKKISKSLGNVFTPQAWLTYGTPKSLLLLMFKRISGTRNLSVEDIPVYMDEYDTLEDVYFGRGKEANPAKLRKLKGLYEYINHLAPPRSPSIHAPYRLIAQLASVAPKDNPTEYVVEKLKSYRTIREADEDFKKRVRLAFNWAEEFRATEKIKVELTPGERRAIIDIVRLIKTTSEPEAIQNKIFEAAKANKIPPPKLFKMLYKILIGSERGPRLGPYIADIGTERAAEILSEQL
ncbi:MAG: lysine--tRNA ligase [Nitrososphaerales archaeon]